MDRTEHISISGDDDFRIKIILSIFSQKAVRITDINAEKGVGGITGLEDYNVEFLSLINQITSGSIVSINETGTAVYYKPGIIYGGDVEFDCPLSKTIGYYLEMLLVMAPFSKHAFNIRLTGITNSVGEPSVDSIGQMFIPLWKRYGISGDCVIKTKKRGFHPLGGGEVLVKCPIVRCIPTLRFLEYGKIKKISGLALASKLPPERVNTMINVAKDNLRQHLSDIYIHTYVSSGKDAGLSPGFSLLLTAESTTGVLLLSEKCAHPGAISEDIAGEVSRDLLYKISRVGCVDPDMQWMYLLFMALSSNDVSVIRLCEITRFTVVFLRETKRFLGVVFKLKKDDDDSIVASCVGTGYVNSGFVYG